MTIDTSRETFVAALRDVVNDAGVGYSYPDTDRDEYGRCTYVTRTGEASCLIGRVLHKLGVPLDTLRPHEGDSARLVMELLGYEDQTLLDAANKAQNAQDNGVGTRMPDGETALNYEWSYALEAFDEALTSDYYC